MKYGDARLISPVIVLDMDPLSLTDPVRRSNGGLLRALVAWVRRLLAKVLERLRLRGRRGADHVASTRSASRSGAPASRTPMGRAPREVGGATKPASAAHARGTSAQRPVETSAGGTAVAVRVVPPPERSTALAPATDLAPDAADPQHVAVTTTRSSPAPLMPKEAANIPWGYGKDRVTAAALDPHRLYVYWEVTDDAVARARAALGDGGDQAWLNLRIYDTTGLLFDGRNAHHHFDHGFDRSQRQWFFDIHRPTSTVTVEVGLRTRDGAFMRIARSGRVDFPRDEPAAWAEPEWMTVVAATGEARGAGRGMPSRDGGERPEHAFASAPADFTPIPLWAIREPSAGHEAWVRELTESGWERVEWHEAQGEQWFELVGRLEWEGPRTFSTWEAGPFTYPVEVREPTREEWQGGLVVYRMGGVTRVVHGPWQVVIRNLGAHASRAVLGRWQIHRSWVATAGREVRAEGAVRRAPLPPGASEGLAAGASERAWISGSELRLGGGSELWRLGASELRFRGASELLLAGASESRARGASERRLQGASEWLARGASEQVLGRASEALHLGASERRLGGSEGRMAEPIPAPPPAYPKAE